MTLPASAAIAAASDSVGDAAASAAAAPVLDLVGCGLSFLFLRVLGLLLKVSYDAITSGGGSSSDCSSGNASL